jgi:hypothetical protein
MSEAFLERLFPKLGFIVMQCADSGDLVLLTSAPRWFVDAARTAAGGGPATLGGTFPFLDHVRAEADRFWESGEEGVMLGEPFAVPGAAEEYLVRPRLATVEGRRLLLLERLAGSADSRPVLQAARESRLEHERTMLRANDVRAPVETIARLAGQLLETDLPTHALDAVRDVLRAAGSAQDALDRMATPVRPGT